MCEEIIFKCLEENKWIFKDVIIQPTNKGYEVYINREDREDKIVCFVGSSSSLISFLSRLFDNAILKFRPPIE